MFFTNQNLYKMRNTILVAAVLFAACGKHPIVKPTPPIEQPTIVGAWINENSVLSVCNGNLSWGGKVQYTPFAYAVSNDTLMWDMGDNSFAPMYTFTVTKDSLYLYSLTIGTPNVMTFTKHK